VLASPGIARTTLAAHSRSNVINRLRFLTNAPERGALSLLYAATQHVPATPTSGRTAWAASGAPPPSADRARPASTRPWPAGCGTRPPTSSGRSPDELPGGRRRRRVGSTAGTPGGPPRTACSGGTSERVEDGPDQLRDPRGWLPTPGPHLLGRAGAGGAAHTEPHARYRPHHALPHHARPHTRALGIESPEPTARRACRASGAGAFTGRSA
jgi:hypothetical protein